MLLSPLVNQSGEFEELIKLQKISERERESYFFRVKRVEILGIRSYIFFGVDHDLRFLSVFIIQFPPNSLYHSILLVYTHFLSLNLHLIEQFFLKNIFVA